MSQLESPCSLATPACPADNKARPLAVFLYGALAEYIQTQIKRLIFFLITTLTLNSCYFFGENGIEIQIENNSETSITNVKLTTAEDLNSLEFEVINSDDEVSGFFNMEESKSDVSYVLQFTRGNEKEEISGVGYYTNGGSLDSRVVFVIEEDTVFASTSKY